MSPEQAERVLEVVSDALEREPAERDTFLEEACAGDWGLRSEAESLLKQEERVRGFIEEPPGGVAAKALAMAAEEPFVSRQFGAYKTIREIGRGGLGTVYLAVRADQVYQKEVAVKLLRRGLDTDDILRRFRNERQILARLEHPNIARLIDGGTSDDGLPYFVMEYVKGELFIHYAERRGLTTTERLKLFRTVCAAVAHAHQHLVIHRDLKPSNILVTDEGEVKLLDFGIAKVLGAEEEAAFHTLTSLRVMTPDYASPEQVRGDNITTASDVYSLGVVLYELLTGAKPFRLTSRTPPERERAITGEVPPPPSRAVHHSGVADRESSSLKGDLDNIVSMALRTEPARRYASVDQFSDDIRRHLEGLPVLARKDTLRYRSGKFVGRHKIGVAAAALVCLSLMGGIIATLWQAHLATQERDRAERRFTDVRKLSNALLFDIAPKMERLAGSTDARQALVRRALEYLNSLATESAGDGQLQSELAAAYEKVGELQGDPRKPNLSDFPGAISSYEKARDIRKLRLEKSPGDLENLRQFAGDLSALSSIRSWTDDPTGSLKDSKAALSAYEALLKAQPDSIDLQMAAAGSQINLAYALYFNEQLAPAYEPLRKARAALEALETRDPENLEIQRLLGRAHTILSMTLSWDGKQKEGEDEMARAFAIYEPLAATHPQDSVIKQALLDAYLQSSQLFEDEDPARSFDLLVKARDIAEKSVTDDAANVQARQNLAKTYSRIGVIAQRLGKVQEAILHLEKSLLAFTDLEKFDSNHRTYEQDIGRVLMFLGQAKYQQHAHEEALTIYASAMAIFEKMARADSRNNQPVRKMATVHQYVGDAHRDMANNASGEKRRSHLQAARENYQRAFEILLRLQAQKVLAEYDLNYLEELRTALSKLEPAQTDEASSIKISP